MALVLALRVVILLALVAELLLGLFVLERSEGRGAARFLGAFMLLHAVAFSVFSVWHIWRELVGENLTDSAIYLALLLLNFLPAFLVAFAFSYPTLHPLVRRWPYLLILPFVPPILVFGSTLWWPVLFTRGVGASEVPMMVVSFLAYLIVAAVVSVGQSWLRARRAKTALERQRLMYMMKAIGMPMVAFGVFAIIGFTFLEMGGPFDLGPVILLSLISVVPAIALGYGVLRYQVLDLDLKLKWGVRQSTVAGAFIAVFFTVSELAKVFFEGILDHTVLGIVASGLLVFFIAPLQRLGERVSNATMPEVNDTDEHRTRRKQEVYRAAIEEAYADGTFSAKERRLLLRLQESLGINGDEAARLERDVLTDLRDNSA